MILTNKLKTPTLRGSALPSSTRALTNNTPPT
jgi:hypothetical protein